MTTTVPSTTGTTPVITANTLRNELEIQNRCGVPIYYNRFGVVNSAADAIRLDDGAKLTLIGTAAQRAFYAITDGAGTKTLHYIADA
jgi:hypothetical protein